MRLLDSYVILHLEIVVIGAQIHDTLYKGHNCRNVGPAKQQVKDAHTGFPQIKLVNAQTPQQKCQNTGGYLALDGPAGVDAVIGIPLHINLYLLAGLTVCALLLILRLGCRNGSYCFPSVFTFCCTGCQRSAALGTKIFCHDMFPPIS